MSACLAFLASLALPCFAGHYAITAQSGGSIHTQYNSSVPYSSQNGHWGAVWGSWGMNASSSASGTISTTFTWQPDYQGEPVPDSVVVAETCSASWGADAGSGATGSADNGLGFPEQPPGGGSVGGTSSGTRYQVKPGAQTIPLSVNPSVSMSTPIGTIAVSVSYQATITPVVCGLGGVTAKTDDHSLHILIGQGCTAGLSAPGYTFANYQWTIGGDTFKSYEAHGAASGGWAQVTFLTGTDLQQASPHWYWRSEDGMGSESEVVTGAADVYVGGTFVGRATAHSTVSVCAPSYNCWPTPRNVTIDQDNTGAFFLFAGSTTTNGIDWTGKAVPSPPFTTQGQGLWAFVQTTQVSRFYTQNGTVHTFPLNNILGLDTSYPYQPDGGVFAADDPNAGWPDDNVQHSASDRPGISLNNSMTNVNFSDQFWTYMVYRPADIGFGHQWVPLHRIAWSWSANVNEPGGSWANWPGPYPAVLSPVNVTSNGRWMVHPLWSQVISAVPF